MKPRKHEALKRRARRILKALLISLNEGATLKNKKYDLDDMDVGHILRCIELRMAYLKTGPFKDKKDGLAITAAEMADLVELQSRLIVRRSS